MKIIKWIGHPVILIIVYLLLIIEGDNFGGFFLLYLLLSLPHGAPYALLAAFGVACVTIGFNIHPIRFDVRKHLLYILGFLSMVLSLLLFLDYGNKGNTFKEIVPLSTFILFGICSVCFLLRTIHSLMNKATQKKDLNSLRSLP